MNHSEIVSFLWGVADLIRDTFRRGKYQDVILPLTVLRRLDCVLAGTKEFNEALNENPGEHFTPRDVVHLMVDLMLAGDEDRIRREGIVCTVYDPCCGSGGMLMITTRSTSRSAFGRTVRCSARRVIPTPRSTFLARR